MCGTWPPSAKLDFWRNRIWTIPHIWGAHCLHTHQIPWKYLDRGQRYGPKNEICNGPSGDGILLAVSILKSVTSVTFRGPSFLCMIVQNFKKMTQRAAELYAILLFLYLHLNLLCQGHNDTGRHAGRRYKWFRSFVSYSISMLTFTMSTMHVYARSCVWHNLRAMVWVAYSLVNETSCDLLL